MSSYMEKIGGGTNGSGLGDFCFEDSDLEARYPIVYELLSRTRYKGEVRKTATISIFCQDGHLKAVLNDRETRKGCWVTLGSSEEVFADLEASLGSDSPNWRPFSAGYVSRR